METGGISFDDIERMERERNRFAVAVDRVRELCATEATSDGVFVERAAVLRAIEGS